MFKLSDTTIRSMFTHNKSIGSLRLRIDFLLSIILLNFSIFTLIVYIKKKKYLFFILRKKQKIIYFLMHLFYIEPILDIFFFDTL